MTPDFINGLWVGASLIGVPIYLAFRWVYAKHN